VNTTQAEYQVYGPGYNVTGREVAVREGITIEMTAEQYAPYSTLEDVFQYPFTGEFGNTAWIDQEPEAVVEGGWGWGGGWSGSRGGWGQGGQGEQGDAPRWPRV